VRNGVRSARGGGAVDSAPTAALDSSSQSARAPLPDGVRTYSLLDHEQATRTKTVSECLDVPVESPSFISEAQRCRKLTNLQLEIGEHRRKELRRREAHATKAAAYREAEARSRARAEQQLDGYQEGRRQRQEEATRRMSDLQLAAESKIELEHGRETITLEPPASAQWGPRPAPPHLVSHWNTIMGSHADPPPRAHVAMIASYRRPFPPGGMERPYQLSPRWGGAHA